VLGRSRAREEKGMKRFACIAATAVLLAGCTVYQVGPATYSLLSGAAARQVTVLAGVAAVDPGIARGVNSD
jgi:PBP1b-binding outer membrane lipoprotein LpoB